YTAIRLDKPNPLTGDTKYWLPYLRVRPAKGHVVFRGHLMAIVDSGSPYCLFRADVATAIGIRDITTGIEGDIGSVKKGQGDTVYFHKIQLYIESDWRIDVMAGFTPNLSVAALLGRNGFFDQFLVTFDHSGSPPALEVSKIDRVQ
ncbi:MAG TPA: hypothetical protein VEG08_01965, partial [Terriglobales bacterium]|nr:hypothetical protein [Terriglobales bacterium]